MDLREVGYDDRDWINLAQDRDRWRAYLLQEETARIHQDIEKLEAGQSSPRKKKKYTSLDNRIARIVDSRSREWRHDGTSSSWLLYLTFVRSNVLLSSFCAVRTRQWETFTRGLKKVYGNTAVDLSTVSRWASRLSCERGHANIRDTPCSGRPCTARRPDNVQRFNNMAVADKRVTVKELLLQMGIEEAIVCRVLKQLGLKKAQEDSTEEPGCDEMKKIVGTFSGISVPHP
ncbi:hypothetical protein ANN_12881 [Periplaneta americana]|uniref:Uncharacterized protein n=1 Tax=Periplaneta americana TaxID=6978 RepID=A0ABQ8THT2_PERAM|nr:hypothetical protein ANN_12881 [Periplaneta americana]